MTRTRKAGARAAQSVAGFELGSGTQKGRSSRRTVTDPMPRQKPLTDANPLWSRNITAEFVQRIQRTFGYSGSRKQQKEPPQQVRFLALLSYSTYQERIWMVIGLVFAFLAGLCLPTWLVLLAKALDVFSAIATLILKGASDQGFQLLQQELAKLVVAFAILGAISLVVGFAYVAIWTYTGQRQSLRIREKFVHAALRQDAEWFDTNNRQELPTSIANAMVHITAAIGRPMADLFANAVSACASLGVALIMNAPLALVMLAIVPVVALVIASISCLSRSASRKGAQQYVAAGALATEVISGIKTVASLCAEQWALQTYTKHIQSAQNHSIYGGFLTGLMTGLTGLLFYITYAVAFTVGTEQVSRDMQISVIIGCFFSQDPDCRVSGASVICCIYGVILCATFFGLMAPGLQHINLGRQAAATIFGTINRIPVIDGDSKLGTTVKDLRGEIEFCHVFFAYPTQPGRPIFSNFSLKIKAGTSVAFVGPSGSGKSTIAKLMLRFYCPMAGNILVDGQPLGGLRLSWWRKQIGYVAQSPILFPGTIRYNIACGLDDATDEQVMEAAKAACAHEFIVDLPDGYDTYYSGASVQLSGGQMQRICIARAVIRKPAVLLLDEATSALDTNSERQVQVALANIRTVKQITTLTVAHRLSTIVSSDQIAVVSGGVIAELGDHKTLFGMGGIYTTLCESQGITAQSTFEGNGVSHDNVEVSLNIKSEAAMTADVENGLTKSATDENLVEDLELENLYASPWRIVMLGKKEWTYLLLGVFGAILVGVLSPMEGIYTARMVENFYTVAPEDLMAANADEIFAFVLLGCASLVGNLISGCGFSVSGYRLSARMRTLVFEAILRRNIGWFDYPEHSVGELTSRLEADAEEVSKITGWALGYKIRMFSSLGAGVFIALYYSWQVGLVAIACVPLIMASSLVQKYCMVKQGNTHQDGLSPESIFENGLRGIDAVQSYGLQCAVGDNYSVALIPQAQKHTKMGVAAGLVYGLSQFATFGSFAIIFAVGVNLLVSQQVTFQQFFIPILAIMFGSLGIAQVNADFNAQQDGLAAAQRIFTICDEPLDELDPFSADGAKPQSLNGAIQYKNCIFAYPTRPNAPVYYSSIENDGFSLNIDPKQSVAFVGKSGSGKSTALQILLRFYHISAGEVLLDGINLEEISISWLRRQIGYVGQNPTLFAGSIKDNILLGKPDATQEEIVVAAKAAAAHDFILEQADGYDTDIGTGGSLLSGGQRQRIAIARAIVSKPVMLVLDEATAALDNVSEGIVQEALDTMQKAQPRTTLVVAHRLTTVKHCDKIAVLGNGGVLELGNHNDLLEKRSLYHELWSKQGA